MNSKKQLQHPEKIVESLLNLKEELWQRSNQWFHDISTREVLYKINSCLYNEYPVTSQLELDLNGRKENIND